MAYTQAEQRFLATNRPADGLIEAAGINHYVLEMLHQLGKDIIHSVTNPIPKFSGAIHVYGATSLMRLIEANGIPFQLRDYNSENVMNLFETFPTNS